MELHRISRTVLLKTPFLLNKLQQSISCTAQYNFLICAGPLFEEHDRSNTILFSSKINKCAQVKQHTESILAFKSKENAQNSYSHFSQLAVSPLDYTARKKQNISYNSNEKHKY